MCTRRRASSMNASDRRVRPAASPGCTPRAGRSGSGGRRLRRDAEGQRGEHRRQAAADDGMFPGSALFPHGSSARREPRRLRLRLPPTRGHRPLLRLIPVAREGVNDHPFAGARQKIREGWHAERGTWGGGCPVRHVSGHGSRVSRKTCHTRSPECISDRKSRQRSARREEYPVLSGSDRRASRPPAPPRPRCGSPGTTPAPGKTVGPAQPGVAQSIPINRSRYAAALRLRAWMYSAIAETPSSGTPASWTSTFSCCWPRRMVR